MKAASFALVSLSLLAAPAFAGSSPSVPPQSAFGSGTSQPTTQSHHDADYQSWLHRHDGLRQFNAPSQTQQRQDYQEWLHRHDGLRQYNPSGSSGSSFQ